MKEHKVHYRIGENRGACGYVGETTRVKNKVTCKLCMKLLKQK